MESGLHDINRLKHSYMSKFNGKKLWVASKYFVNYMNCSLSLLLPTFGRGYFALFLPVQTFIGEINLAIYHSFKVFRMYVQLVTDLAQDKVLGMWILFSNSLVKVKYTLEHSTKKPKISSVDVDYFNLPHTKRFQF